jgi:hypothetical protein
MVTGGLLAWLARGLVVGGLVALLVHLLWREPGEG